MLSGLVSTSHLLKRPCPELIMSPLRRYLRITPHSVLEVRIYLDNPADSMRWLLNPRDPVLPRVLEAVKPLVLPKLREENERNGVGWKGKGKGGAGRKKGVKDLVGTGMFELRRFSVKRVGLGRCESESDC